MSETMWWMAVVAALIASDVALVWLGFAWHRRTSAGRTRAALSSDRLRSEFATLRSAIDGLDSCLSTVDQAIAKSSERAERKREAKRSEVRAAPSGAEAQAFAQARSYAIAERLARKGASVDALVADCGLSRGEAELICNVHGPRSRRTRKVA